MVCPKCNRTLPRNSNKCEYCVLDKKKSVLGVFLVLDIFDAIFCLVFFLPAFKRCGIEEVLCLQKKLTAINIGLPLFIIFVILSMILAFEYSRINRRLFELRYHTYDY